MSRASFTFGGRNSLSDLGLQIEGEPRYITGQKVVDTYKVPGRNGSLIFDTGAYTDGAAEYTVSLVSHTLEADLYKAAGALMGPEGWQALTDTQEPTITRYAYCDNALEVVRKLKLTGKGTIHFRCKPQRYITSDLTTQRTLTSGGTVTNDYLTARPVFEITGSGSGTLTVNSTVVTISTITTGMLMDCENCMTYKGTTNLSDKVSITGYDYPVLVPGSNTISWTGGITGVKMIPRFWTL